MYFFSHVLHWISYKTLHFWAESTLSFGWTKSWRSFVFGYYIDFVFFNCPLYALTDPPDVRYGHNIFVAAFVFLFGFCSFFCFPLVFYLLCSFAYGPFWMLAVCQCISYMFLFLLSILFLSDDTGPLIKCPDHRHFVWYWLFRWRYRSLCVGFLCLIFILPYSLWWIFMSKFIVSGRHRRPKELNNTY